MLLAKLRLWNPKVYSRVYKSPPPVPILSQFNPVHVLSSFLNTHFNIIFPSTRKSFTWSLYLRFPTKTLPVPLLSHIRATCPAHLILLDLMTRVSFGGRTNHEAPHYTISSTPLLPRPSLAQMSLEDPQPTFFHQYEGPSFTPIQKPSKL
jgi:hypothetical protein